MMLTIITFRVINSQALKTWYASGQIIADRSKKAKPVLSAIGYNNARGCHLNCFAYA